MRQALEADGQALGLRRLHPDRRARILAHLLRRRRAYWVEQLLVSLPGGQIGFLIFVNVVVFLLAFFLDFFELAFIIVPLLAGPAEELGIDLIWFGVILGINMQTSFMHPPFGFALFYLRSVAPRESYKDRVTGKRMEPVTTGQIYWGAVPFVIIQCIMVGLVIAFPQMVMHYKGTGADGRSRDDRDLPVPTDRPSATGPWPSDHPNERTTSNGPAGCRDRRTLLRAGVSAFLRCARP